MTLLIQTEELAAEMAKPTLILIDVRSTELYSQGHLPNARRLENAAILRQQPPIGGLLPEPGIFNTVLQALGINDDSLVVAYDGEGSAAASRLIWTLHAFGFYNTRLLNGGFTAWVGDGREITAEVPVAPASSINLMPTGDAIISAEALMAKLAEGAVHVLDSRTSAEFIGADVRAKHGGRIPGAVHYEWTEALDSDRDLRLLPDEQLKATLEARGITPDKPVVVYCQTHHRSSLSYTMLKHLGYEVTALEGAWSNWGNRDDTPKEQG